MGKMGRRIRSAVLMGLTWAVVWAVVAVLLSLVIDPDGSMDEPWALVGAYPGFISGLLFWGVRDWVRRRRGVGQGAGRAAASGPAVAELPPE